MGQVMLLSHYLAYVKRHGEWDYGTDPIHFRLDVLFRCLRNIRHVSGGLIFVERKYWRPIARALEADDSAFIRYAHKLEL